MTTTTTLFASYVTVADTAHALINVSTPFYSCNLHVEDNDVFYGNGTNMTATAVADSVISLEKGDLAHIFFMNKVGAAVAHISVVATVDKPE